MTTSKILPLTILLDIDGTLIGDITPQVVLYDIVEKIRSAGIRGMVSKVKHDKETFQSKLTDGIIRPYFKSFFQQLSGHGVEFFIYTASEKKWAEHLIKNVEQALGIQFNRPLFTRGNCKLINSEYMKSIRHVRPAIIKTLNRKYKAKFTDTQNRIMAIDNKRVYLPEDMKYMVHCNTYKYNIPENIPAFVKKPMYDKFAHVVNNVLTTYYPTFKEFKTYIRFEKQFYTFYVQQLSDSISTRGECKTDTLFKTIMSLFLHKHISIFNDNTISYINNKLSK